jgi:hypothetical protein
MKDLRKIQEFFSKPTDDKIDTITMDIPLFIRSLEYAREDAKDDMDLHNMAEKAIKGTKQKGILSMVDYDDLTKQKIKEVIQQVISEEKTKRDRCLRDEAAFIEGIDEIWASAQQTLATGGGAVVLSTPYGVGNWFHKTWVRAEAQENDFLPIKLPWYVHPERNEAWRKRQDELLGDPKLAAQECDCDFNTSGDIVFHAEWIDFLSQTTIQEPIERRGADKNLWIWEPADYSRDYMVMADVARGDGKDFSGCHVVDIESNTQVAEFRGQLPPKEYGYFLTGLATEYNNALLIVENSNIGWSTIDAIIERGYRNLYYAPKSEAHTYESYFNKYESSSNTVPGFSMNLKTRPLVVNKFREYIGDRSVIIRSKRLLEEMKVFIWKNGRPEAQTGYNDDLVMSFGIGMYLRDTSLKFQQQSIDLSRAALNNISSNKHGYSGAYSGNNNQNPFNMNVGGRDESIRWLL